MTPTTPVLAWVVSQGWAIFDSTNTLKRFIIGTKPDVVALSLDAAHPNLAPHTVRQLAEVVAVVTIDDAMVARGASVLRSAKWDLTLHTYEEIVRAALTAALGEAPGTGARPTAQGA